jgi:hypothetical protein
MSISASAGVTLGTDVKVDLEVVPQDNGDVSCVLNCNGKQSKVIYRASGETDFDQYPFSE